jgi:folate-binding protein YgfZ
MTENGPALLLTKPARGTLEVRGPDRATWLNGVVTCDVSKVTRERAALGLALSKHGKILSDLWIAAGPESLFVGVAPEQHGVLAAYFERLLVMEDAEVRDRSDDLTWLYLHGAAAPATAAPIAAELASAWGELDLTGLGGAALVIPSARATQALSELGRTSGVVRSVGPEWQQLRVSRGVPEFGVDYGLEDNPHEAGLDQRAVCWTKGCYLGQEVVCMQGMRGKVKRRVVLLRIEGTAPLVAGASVLGPDQQPVGELTSVAPRESDGARMALARLSGGAASLGAVLVEGRRATIVERSALA